MAPVLDSTKNLQLLSEVLFTAASSDDSGQQGTLSKFLPNYPERVVEAVSRLTLPELEELKALADTNHVVMRCFEPMQQILGIEGKWEAADWLERAIKHETARIHHALPFLERICSTLDENGCPATVIKSLDHWPDLGSDLDLFVDGDPNNVIDVMRGHFNATLENRSWGDRLANKWNFVVPGLPELVEVHVGRLGQTGEQTAITRSLASRTHLIELDSYTFRVPAPEDRIVISTLQRMYRHFYIRICDIADNARLLDSHSVDFAYLHEVGSAAGLWDGIATYLTILSEYVEAYRGHGLPLPALVTGTAKFGTKEVRFRRNFLRVPILPHSVNLYAAELKNLLLKGELRNTIRLTLLPGLATAAALEQKLTGSDKGIW
jgi:hypothetical protein